MVELQTMTVHYQSPLLGIIENIKVSHMGMGQMLKLGFECLLTK